MEESLVVVVSASPLWCSKVLREAQATAHGMKAVAALKWWIMHQ